MICLMHEGTPYGHLKVNRKVILPPNLARIAGATLAETEGWLGELEEAGVFDRDEDGAIVSKRMIRDEDIRNRRAAGGKLGGNPALGKNNDGLVDDPKVNLPPNLNDETKVNQNPTPAFASAPASAPACNTPPKSPEGKAVKKASPISQEGKTLAEWWGANHPYWRDKDSSGEQPGWGRAIDELLKTHTEIEFRRLGQMIFADCRGKGFTWAANCQSPKKLTTRKKDSGELYWNIISGQLEAKGAQGYDGVMNS